MDAAGEGWTLVMDSAEDLVPKGLLPGNEIRKAGDVAEDIVHYALEGAIHLARVFLRRRSHGNSVDGQVLPEENLLHFPHSVAELNGALKRGIDPNIPNDFGNAPIHSLITAQQNDKKLKANLLYTFLTECGEEVFINLPNKDGNTALHLAVESKDIKLVRILLAFGADINQRNFKSKTPLDFCHGSYLFMHRQDSFMEVSVNDSLSSLGLRENNIDDLKKLLNDCGAVRGEIAADYSMHRREHKKSYREFYILREEEYYKDREAKKIRHSSSIEEVKDDWCQSKAELYHMYWTRVMQCPLTFFDDDIHKAADFGVTVKNMRLLQMAGSRVLVLDGGGMKGLVEIEILDQIEKATGMKIVDLFDWIVGTSTGAIITLALVYARLSLNQVRQLFFKMKDVVFGSGIGPSYSTDNLTKVLQEVFKEMTMSHKTYPRVIITAVDKTCPEHLKLKFFGNHPDIDKDYQSKLVWKVARYTSAAPIFFEELDNYVDGGVLANNPASAGLTFIQEMYSKKKTKIPISILVSLGSGIMPTDELDKENSRDFIFFGHIKKMYDKASGLITLLGNAITESEQVATDMSSRCKEQGIRYFRCSPRLSHIVGSGETDRDVLIDAVLDAKRCSKHKRVVDTLMLWFPTCWSANRDLLKSGLL